MQKNRARFVQNLLDGLPQTLVVFGTSLSYHLAPILRPALEKQFDGLISIVNSGLSAKASRTAFQVLDDKVLRHAPNTLLVEWAVNDAHDYFHEPDALDAGITLEESRANLEMLIDRVQLALPRCEIILWTTNTTFDDLNSTMRSGSARPHLSGYYEGVRAVASARGLSLIDAEKFWESMRKRSESEFRILIPDGAHPTPRALREYLVPFLLDEWGVPHTEQS